MGSGNLRFRERDLEVEFFKLIVGVIFVSWEVGGFRCEDCLIKKSKRGIKRWRRFV